MTTASIMLGLFITTGSAPYRYTAWTPFSFTLGLASLAIPALSKLRSKAHGSGAATRQRTLLEGRVSTGG